MQDLPIHTYHRGTAARCRALPSAIVSLVLLSPAVAVAQPVAEPAPPAATTPTPAPAPPPPTAVPPTTVTTPQPLPAPPPELDTERVPSAASVEYATEPPTQFDNSLDIYLAPGALNVPYGGIDNVDYGESFDPGYQWGLGIGYFGRGSSDFAVGVGAFFDHAIINSEGRDLGDASGENVFRVGLELRPGVVIGERLFLNLPLRGGYAADVVTVADESNINHGPIFGIALGADVAITRGFYIGTAVGTDLHFFRAGRDFDAYLVTWRTMLGYRF